MKNLFFGISCAACLSVFLLAGCASITVKSEAQESAHFENYERFALVEAPDYPASSTDPRLSPILLRRINETVAAQLARKGYTQTAQDQADFIVATGANIKKEFDLASSVGGGYDSGGGWFGSISIPVGGNSDEIILTVDVTDAKSNALVWRGWARTRISEEPDLARIQEAVLKIMEQFPPE